VKLFRHQIGVKDLAAGDMSAPPPPAPPPLQYSGNENKSRLLNPFIHNMALSSCERRLSFVEKIRNLALCIN